MKITRRQIETPLVEKIEGSANKAIVLPPGQTGGMDTAAAGQYLQTLAFDTTGDIDQVAGGMGQLTLSDGRRLSWDGAFFALVEPDDTVAETFYDLTQPEGSRWLLASYTFPGAVSLTGISVPDRSAGAWPLTSYAYQPPQTALDFPAHVSNQGNPHGVTAAQAGTYTGAEIDAMNNALAHLTYGDAYWFGRRASATPWPLPADGETWDAGARNGFDFSTNTPWEWDGAQWTEGSPIGVINGTTVGVSSQFLDIAEAGLPGLARYSAGKNSWDYYPNKYNTMDPEVFERNIAGEETIKEKGILTKHLSDSLRDEMLKALTAPGEFGYTFMTDEAALAAWRRMPADGRTIPVTDPRAERLLQYCLIAYSAANANADISGLYLTNDNWPTHAAAAASGKPRATPAENGAYLAIPDGCGLFARGRGTNAFRKAADDTPYDGGAIGTFQSFGTMGRPDRNNRIYLASEAADGPNRNFFPRMLTGQEIIPGAMLTMPYDGELRIFCHGVVLTHHTPILTVNGEMVHRGTTYGYYSDWLTFHTDVKAGDNVLLHIWSSTTETLPQNGQSYAMLYLRVHDKGSISANSYMTY